MTSSSAAPSIEPAVTTTSTSTGGAVPVDPARGVLRPLGIDAVRFRGGFWGERQDVNAAATLPHVLGWLEREGWVASFDHVANGTTAGRDRPGWNFSDSEVYKFMEALVWESARNADPWAETTLRELTERVGRAQDDDGYLNTAFGHAGQPGRYSDLALGHELYVVGHLLQAAVARLRTVGRDALVDIAVRAADHVCREFGESGRDAICGHPEIEVALLELGRALIRPDYARQAALFLARRGRGTLGDRPFGRAYFQDDVPIAEAPVLRGHAVRALYLTAAAVDAATDRGDAAALTHLRAQWERTVSRRTYLTGGMGSRHQDEGFGEDWELPNDRAYCETCAGIGSLMVTWRLLLATGDPTYADLFERTLYNIVAVSPGDDGRSFFYANTLHQRTAGDPALRDASNPRAESSERAPWFDVSCCPTNLARTFASLQAYVATVSDAAVQLHQLVACDIDVVVPGAGRVRMRVDTGYPDDGTVLVTVLESPADPWRLDLRVPSWCPRAEMHRPHDEGVESPSPGLHGTTRRWRPGDQVRLVLPRPTRTTCPDPRVDATRGCLAFERGPDVLALEAIDLPASWSLDEVVVEPDSERPGDRGTRVRLLRRAGSPASRLGPSTRASTVLPAPHEECEVDLVPYRRWGNRSRTAMRIWIPEA